VAGDADDAFAGKARFQFGQPARQRGLARVFSPTHSSASITVLPVMCTRAGSTFSRSSAAWLVAVGAKCRLAMAPMILRFTSSGQG
jgi:hypothetical protein